jgi:RNA polymerase sigma-70 factor (ECF subfamily)
LRRFTLNTRVHSGVTSPVDAFVATARLLVQPVIADSDLDRELVARFQAGERSAFDQLVRRHQRGVWRIVRRYLRADADAADVTQQVFVRAFKALGGFRGAASVRSWLYRIAIHASLSWIRDHRREQPTELDDDALVEAAHAPAAIDRGRDSARLRAAVAELPPKQRLVLELRVFDDLSFKEVAELAECSENTAKVNFHYAVKRLREILGGEPA